MQILFTLLISVLSYSCTTATSEEQEKPNLIIILCDDLGYNDLGFMGSKDIPTPHLDKLAHNGTIFSSAYVPHPFCGPSRTSLMTGRYAHEMGAQFNLPPNSETIGKGIPLEETFISKVLQDSGYKTGIMGKWHLGAIEKYHPNNRGFDEFYGFLGGGHNYIPEIYEAAYARQKAAGVEVIRDYLRPLEHNGAEVRETEYLTDGLSREAVSFVNKSSKEEKPFFLYLSYNAPHTPLQGKPEDLQRFMDIKDEKRRNYAAMVYAVDRGVGRLVQALEDSKQLDNTLIVFMSDNGGKTIAGANNYPLREGKGSTCEGGYRVPMFFHWPGNVAKGKTNNHPISAMDLYPTFAHLAQATIPASKEIDGKNIWSDFQNNTNPYEDESIFVLRHREGYSDVGIRKNEFKALRTEQNDWKLYAINDDIGETRDIATEHPEELKAMVKEAESWSQTHIQPQWWHDKATGLQWEKDDMPHFDKTFELK